MTHFESKDQFVRFLINWKTFTIDKIEDAKSKGHPMTYLTGAVIAIESMIDTVQNSNVSVEK